MVELDPLDPDLLLAMIQETGLLRNTTSNSYILSCPRCGKPDKLYLAKANGRFKCFSGACSEAKFDGKPEFFFAEALNLSPSEAAARLRGEDAQWEPGEENRQLPDLYGEDEPQLLGELVQVEWPPGYYPIDHPAARPGAEYLLGRGVPLAVAQLYRIRYDGREGMVVFPVEVGGMLVGWQKRAVNPNHPRPKTSSLDMPQVWMFQDRLRESEHAVVAEGPISAIKAHGCSGNVASMGKGTISAEKLQRLLASGVKRIYLGLDPDAALETAELVRRIGDRAECFRMDVPADKDLGDLTFGQVRDLFDRARPFDPAMLATYVPEFSWGFVR